MRGTSKEKSMSIRFPRRMVLTLALAAAFGASASEAEWAPTKTVRIVVPIVGSTNDVLARLVAPELQKVLGQAVIVENKGGAGGTIGANDVAKSPPDGHTLLVGFNGPIAINPTLFPKMPYDSVKDLSPITLAVKSPQFGGAPSVPAKDVKDSSLWQEGKALLRIRFHRQRIAPHDGDVQVGSISRRHARSVQGSGSGRGGPHRRTGRRGVPGTGGTSASSPRKASQVDRLHRDEAICFDTPTCRR
jgi:hypothetical protein